MRKSSLVLFVLYAFLFLAIDTSRAADKKGKTSEAPPQKHELKVYVSPNQSVYWPMDKPVYVRLATAPRGDAPSFLLNHVYEKTEDELKKIKNEGIKLEIPGSQFVRWADFLKKNEKMLKFFADGAPPESSINLFDAPTYQGKNRQYFGKKMKVKVVGKDPLSGVKQTYVSINGAPFDIHTDNVPMNTEGTFQIRYYSVDNVGYAEPPSKVSFVVDLTPPVSNHKLKTNYIGQTLSTSTHILPFSKDTLSGVKDIYYTFEDNKKFEKVALETGVPVAALNDGPHTLTYFGVDRVLNEETHKTFDFYLDRMPCETDYSFVGDLYKKGKKTFVSPRTRVLLSATDNKSGVRLIEYNINDERYVTYVKPFAPPFKTGDFSVTYRAFDKLSNKSPSKTVALNMDLSAPKTVYKTKGPSHVQGGVQWLTRKTVLSLHTSDDLAGIQHIYYQLADSPETIYQKPITIEKEGQYLFKYWATDNVNNKEMFSPILLIVDNAAPKIIEVFSIEPISDYQGTQGETINVYPMYTTLFLGAMDNSAGLKNIVFSLNGAPYKTYNETMMFDKKGSYTVSIRAVDHVGNTASKKTTFVISDQN